MEGRVGRKEKGQGGAGAAQVLEANKVNPFIKWVWGKLNYGSKSRCNKKMCIKAHRFNT